MPVISPDKIATGAANPISCATFTPITVNTIKPMASRIRNSIRKRLINGATQVVTRAAMAVSARYSGWATQTRG